MLSTSVQKSATGSSSVRKEIRFALVMYGGVSLAIYENGIAQEFLSLVRATARKTWTSSEFRFVANGDSGTTRDSSRYLHGAEPIYRELGQCLSQPDTDNNIRFVVDVISGTSAGGINGIFLAKSLSNAQSMEQLKKLWIEEGDIAKLLNDDASVHGTNLRAPKSPAALLNGQRMYWKLLEAFDGMDQLSAEAAKVNVENPVPGEPLVDGLELYVTTTDIRGRVTPLRTYDRLIFERRHRFAFEFGFAPAGRNEERRGAESKRINPDNAFEYCDNPMLALAARCTSSFPFAFEPMRLQLAIEALKARHDSRTERVPFWKKNFFAREHIEEEREINSKIEHRSFGDGGYVDNKPFGFAIDAMARRTGVVPSERKLIFIEPAPEHPERDAARNPHEENTPPNAIENAWAALVAVPGYETIREDLLRVNERGRLVRKVNDLIEFVWNSVASSRETPEGTSVSTLAETNLPASSYYTLRAFDLTDVIGNVICQIRGISRHSSYFYAVRSLVRALRERNYQGAETSIPLPAGFVRAGREGATLLQFLHDFDLWFHIRRLRFVASEITRLYKLDDSARARLRASVRADVLTRETVDELLKEGSAAASFRRALDQIFLQLNISFTELRLAERQLIGEPVRKAVDDAFRAFSRNGQSEFLSDQLGAKRSGDHGPYAARERADDDYAGRARAALLVKEADEAFAEAGAVLSSKIREAIDRYSIPKMNLVASDGHAEAAIRLIQHYLAEFEQFDCVVFPVLYETDIGSLDTVDIIRFSPEDATELVNQGRDNRYKLAGITLGHFGAFLEKEWRRFDMLWGRLDAAERIIRALMPPTMEKQIVDMVTRAHNAILLEELGDEALQALVKDVGLLSPPLETSRTEQMIRRLVAWRSRAGDRGSHPKSTSG